MALECWALADVSVLDTTAVPYKPVLATALSTLIKRQPKKHLRDAAVVVQALETSHGRARPSRLEKPRVRQLAHSPAANLAKRSLA